MYWDKSFNFSIFVSLHKVKHYCTCWIWQFFTRGNYLIIALKQYRLYHSNDTASLAWLQVSLFTWLAIPV